MKYSLLWLQDIVNFKKPVDNNFYDKITNHIAEIEEVTETGKNTKDIKIGIIEKIFPHPDADKMQITETRVGDKVYQIVCGAKNIKVGLKVPVALEGVILPGDFMIKKVKKRGVLSEGMICSEEELGLSESSEGIMELSSNAKIGENLNDYLQNEDTVIEVENTTLTNRPDLFSHLGLAKELVANDLAEFKNNYPKDLKDFKIDFPQKEFPFNLKIQEKDICPRYTSVIIKNLEIKESPDFFKKRLTNCGIRPINNIVDITNFVMFELGIPLHAFDLESIKGDVVMRKSKKGEKVKTLDSIERTLKEDIIILEDEEKIFDLCGIMGGENSEIKNNTKNICLHSPIYDPTLIRRASIFLNHRTDASLIYEKRVPSIASKYGILRAINLLKEICPEISLESKLLEIDNEKIDQKIIEINKKEIDKVLGEINDIKLYQEILEKLDFKVKIKDNVLVCQVPKFRYQDINIKADLVEEIMRVFGLEKIKTILPKISLDISNSVKFFREEQKIKNYLANFAFECVNYSFLAPKFLEKTLLNKEDFIKIKNPLSEDLSLLRNNLLPSLLKNLISFKDYENLFEIAKIQKKTVEGFKEENHLCFLAYAKDFHYVKDIFNQMIKNLNFNYKIFPTKNNYSFTHPKKTAEIMFQGKDLGIIAEINPQINKNLNLKEKICFFEINLEVLKTAKLKNKKFEAFSSFPKIFRDQNLLIKKEVLVGDFLKKIFKKIPNLIDLKISDIYEGKDILKDYKCITLKSVYQSFDRTLTDEEVNEAQKQLINKALENKAQLRNN
jgi:phenylalanyl-tRNA synthetase beta chain